MAWTPDPKTIDVKWQDVRPWPDRGYAFAAPAIDTPTAIRHAELYLAIGRMLALRSARDSVVRMFQRNARAMIGVLVDRNSCDFRALADTADLPDQSLVQFAHDVAVGTAAIAMQDAGFIWADHAKRLLPAGLQRPDYVWSAGHWSGGVVLSEVKGMTSGAAFGRLRRRTERAWHEQVADWALDHTLAGEPILGGYAIGVHVPGGREAGMAVIRSYPVWSGEYPPPYPFEEESERPGREGPSVAVAKGHYRAVLSLIGARGLARRLLPVPLADLETRRFDIIQTGDLSFVVPGRPQRGDLVPALELDAFRFAQWLALDLPGKEKETEGGEHVFRAGSLASGRAKWSGPLRVPAPTFDPAMAANEQWQGAKVEALAPDGLALIRRGLRTKVVRELEVSGESVRYL